MLPATQSSILFDAYISLKKEQAMATDSQGTAERRDGFGMMMHDALNDFALEEYEDSKPLVKQKSKRAMSMVDHHKKKLKRNLIISP